MHSAFDQPFDNDESLREARVRFSLAMEAFTCPFCSVPIQWPSMVSTQLDPLAIAVATSCKDRRRVGAVIQP